MLVSLEAYTVTASLLFFTQLAVRRTRPSAEGCRTPGGDCDPNDRRGFPGGHTAIATTNAALTCQQHLTLPLYGGGPADPIACAFWIAGAATVFVTRILNDAHYLSDQLAGLGAGLVGGLLVPRLLHFGAGEAEASSAESSVALLPVPRLYTNGLGLEVVGVYR